VEDENTVIAPEAAARTGPDPRIVLSTNGNLVSEVVACTASLIDGRAAPKTVAVLYNGAREGAEIAAALDVEGLEYFWATDPQNKQNRDQIAAALEPVVLSTVASAKGMEFPSVVLSCSPRSRDQDPEELRRTIYVGMTRATENLAVFADKSHILADDLARAATDGRRLGRLGDDI
jgi:superfamily I DNA/RNA helicase